MSCSALAGDPLLAARPLPYHGFMGPGPRPVRILIADDHSIVREGLTAVIGREPDMKIVGEARTWPDAIERARRATPDLAVLDPRMPGMDPAEGIARLHAECPAVQIVVFADLGTDEEVHDAVRAGARGYVPRGEFGCADLLACIRAVSCGQMWLHPLAATKLAEWMAAPGLTPRETEVLRLIAAGRSNKEIGAILDVAEGTVKVHVNHILGKLGVGGRVEAVVVAARRGVVQL